jgi:hypothetical protein
MLTAQTALNSAGLASRQSRLTSRKLFTAGF